MPCLPILLLITSGFFSPVSWSDEVQAASDVLPLVEGDGTSRPRATMDRLKDLHGDDRKKAIQQLQREWKTNTALRAEWDNYLLSLTQNQILNFKNSGLPIGEAIFQSIIQPEWHVVEDLGLLPELLGALTTQEIASLADANTPYSTLEKIADSFRSVQRWSSYPNKYFPGIAEVRMEFLTAMLNAFLERGNTRSAQEVFLLWSQGAYPYLSGNVKGHKPEKLAAETHRYLFASFLDEAERTAGTAWRVATQRAEEALAGLAKIDPKDQRENRHLIQRIREVYLGVGAKASLKIVEDFMTGSISPAPHEPSVHIEPKTFERFSEPERRPTSKSTLRHEIAECLKLVFSRDTWNFNRIPPNTKK